VNSRGCPMHCAFCEHSGSSPRWYSPEHFEAEICNIADLGFKGIMIFDDLFALSPRKLNPYLDILRRYHRHRDVIFRCFGHARIISRYPTLLKMLADSGCVEIGVGAESASQSILDIINKRTKVDQLHACVNQAARMGIKVKAFFMVGLPGETERTFALTHEFIKFYRKKYPFHFDFDLSVFFPYRGTLIGDAIRLNDGESIQVAGRRLDRCSFDVRLNPEYTWDLIDSGNMGAYKKKGGSSDLVIESYDWNADRLLLSAQRIKALKDLTMKYSGRYATVQGHLNLAEQSVSEGNIGHADSANMRKSA
jgi:anaerobic magnesium-protoporphyrin IX monomethyl ester cyclase